MYRIILLLFICFPLFGGGFYVAPHGSDLNKGDKWFRPFKSLQKAADMARAGDTVYVMKGDYYTRNISLLHIQRSGTEKDWIVYKNYLNHKPVLHLKNQYGIWIQSANFISIEGFTIVPEKSQESGSNSISNVNTGIHIDGTYTSPCTHIKIYNNFIKDLSGNGIKANFYDYLIISYNKFFNNATLPDANGCIYLYHSLDSDGKPAIHNFIQANVLEKNSTESVSCQSAIYIQDNPNYYNRNYLSRIHNNIIYSNGGGGIKLTDGSGVQILHNTLYKNSELSICESPEIELSNCNLFQVMNNIFYSSNGKPGSFVRNSNNIRLDHNLYFNFSQRERGKNDILKNPEFELTNDVERLFNFRLKGNSPAINAGIDELLSDLDYEGNPRKLDTHVDIGALEFTNRILPSLKNFKEGVASTGTSGMWSSLFLGDQKVYTLWNHKNKGFSIRIFDSFGNLFYENIRPDDDENSYEIDFNYKPEGYYTVFAYNLNSTYIERILVKSKSSKP